MSVQPSLYEQLQALTVVMKQRFVENFSGDSVDERWSASQAAGSGGSATLEDAIDEGVVVKSGTGANNSYVLTFNSKRQYDFDASVLIAVVKRGNSPGGGLSYSGLSNANIGFTSDTAAMADSQSDTFKKFNTRDTSTSSTNTTVNTDTAFHLQKQEQKASSIELSIDNNLEVTATTQLPNTKLQPLINSDDSANPNLETNCRYMEVYNT